MREIRDLDLRLHHGAIQVVKDEVVAVTFATHDGEIVSAEGVNRYQAGDALITGSTPGRWSVSRDRFALKYLPMHAIAMGEPGAYRNKPIVVWALQQHEPFCISRCKGGDLLQGAALDWLLQYADDDFGVVQNARFNAVYRPKP